MMTGKEVSALRLRVVVELRHVSHVCGLATFTQEGEVQILIRGRSI